MKPELLAPAGNLTCLRAAIQGGCDAIYFGINELNMRAGAKNFALDDLDLVADVCRTHDVRAYLTLNTILYDQEMTKAEAILEKCRNKVDAVICWDPGIIQLCQKLDVPFHISTQASVANCAAAGFYKSLGAQRIVLARECTLSDIQRIRKQTGISLEVFVHGAMCVSISGRCFLSQFNHGKSANRGECLQNCRREYHITSNDDNSEYVLGDNYVLSAKDLCTLPFFEKLLSAGIDAVKIEGRNRNPEYVRTVVAAYRTAIDAWHEGKLSDSLKHRLVREVRQVYNRDFSNGFYLGKPIGDFTDTSGSKATRKKTPVGRVKNYFSRAKAVEILIQDHVFAAGDTLMIQGNTTGVIIFAANEIRQNEQPVSAVSRGIATVALEQKARVNDKVFRLEPTQDKRT